MLFILQAEITDVRHSMSQMDAKHHKAIDTEQKNAEKRYQDLEEKFRDLEIRYQQDVFEHKTLIDQLKKVLPT